MKMTPCLQEGGNKDVLKLLKALAVQVLVGEVQREVWHVTDLVDASTTIQVTHVVDDVLNGLI